MMNSSSNSKEGSRAQPVVVEDADPEPEYIDPNANLKSMYENFALSVYREWADRNPDRARRSRYIRECGQRAQERWDDAAEVLGAMMSAGCGPAPPKFSAAKGLQSLMQRERVRKAKTHTVEQCAASHRHHHKSNHHSSSKSKNHPSRKKGRHFCWSPFYCGLTPCEVCLRRTRTSSHCRLIFVLTPLHFLSPPG